MDFELSSNLPRGQNSLCTLRAFQFQSIFVYFKFLPFSSDTYILLFLHVKCQWSSYSDDKQQRQYCQESVSIFKKNTSYQSELEMKKEQIFSYLNNSVFSSNMYCTVFKTSKRNASNKRSQAMLQTKGAKLSVDSKVFLSLS